MIYYKLVVLLLLAAASPGFGQRAPKSGFLLTVPKQLQAGTMEQACVTLYQLPGPGRHVNMRFVEQDVPFMAVSYGLPPREDEHQHDGKQELEEFELFLVNVSVPDNVSADGEHCFQVEVPQDLTARQADLRLTVSNSAGVQLQQTARVSLRSLSLVTLIQTDKAKYQPGQKVQFRIISLHHNLTALPGQVTEVWVTTPLGTRVAQWRDVATNIGMVQLELQLTEEPPLGQWTIHAKTRNDLLQSRFEVEEYVLPTFEVTLETPHFIIKGEKTLTISVCAKYTFGKPVIGANVSVNATSGVQQWQREQHPEIISNIYDYQTSDKSGCAVFDLLVSKIGIGHPDIYGSSSVTLHVTVEEFGTKLEQKEMKVIHETRASFNLETTGNTQKYFKPNLPYYGQYTMKRQDGSPASNELLNVCYTAKYKSKDSEFDQGPKTVPKDILYKASEKYADHIQAEYGYRPFFWETENPATRNTQSQCREYRSDHLGRVVYFIPPQSQHVDSIVINVDGHVNGASQSDYRSIKGFFSPTSSYLTIEAHNLPDRLSCSGNVTVQLLLSQPNEAPPQLRYKVMSRGNIVLSGIADSTENLTLPIQPSMAPQFKLLVYYVLNSSEIISDARTFQLQECFTNKVTVSWDQETVLPGKEAAFSIRADPNSVCGISAVDKSSELLGAGKQLTAAQVFSKLKQLTIQPYQYPTLVESDDTYCKKVQLGLVETLKSGGADDSDLSEEKDDADDESKDNVSGGGMSASGSIELHRHRRPEFVPTYRTDRIDALTPFDDLGFLAVTNLGVESRPCYKRVQAEEIPEDLLQYSSNRKQQAALQTIPQDSSAQNGFRRAHSTIQASSSRIQESAPVAFALSAESVSADSVGANSAGLTGALPPPPDAPVEDQIRAFFPEAFLFSIETIGPEGIKVLENKMPDSITSFIGSAVCTNSESGFGMSNTSSITTFKPFFVDTTLPYSVKRGEILNMSATVFNFLESDLSVSIELLDSNEYTLKADVRVVDTCLSAGRSEVVYFPLDFSHLGQVNVSVKVNAKDGNCDHPNVIQAGSDTVIRSIVIKAEGFPQEQSTSRFVCLDEGDDNHIEKVALQLPNELVKNSARAFVSVMGDLLAPTLDNLNALIAAPTGGAEPNMVTFVPNIHMRKYLETTGLITESTRRETENNMKSGYQRQLRYRRSEGSYSSYGNSDPEASLWLTAFVAKSFNEAAAYIDIDSAAQNETLRWLLARQRAEDGCFPRLGQLIHKELKGGVERGGEAALTGYTLLAVRHAASVEQTAAAIACMERTRASPNATLYAKILVAYTHLTLEMRASGERMVDVLLKDHAVREGDDLLHWQGDRQSIYGGSLAVDIEMTGYMVMALLKLSGRDRLEDASRAVHWLISKRNANGGFVSSQDTVVGLQALSEFASRTFSSSLSTTVVVRSSTPEATPVTRTVDSSNRLLQQRNKLPAELQLPTEIEFNVSAPGCVYLLTDFRYNSQLKVAHPAFSLGVSSAGRPGRRLSYTMEVCTSYTLSEAGRADSAILSVELPSGYIAVDSTLRQLKQHGVVERYEVSDGSVTFTLADVSEDKTCIPFRILQESKVDLLKPANVEVFDFYRPEHKNLQEYQLTPVSA